MTTPREYASASAFRTALEARLNNLARVEKVDLQRLRRQVAFDRLLCRLFDAPNAPWLLKGGYAMELRIRSARATRDIDLAMKQPPDAVAGQEALARDVLELLRDAVRTSSPDRFEFLIAVAVQDLEAAPYGGARYPVEARLAGRAFARFHLDVSVGDAHSESVESLAGGDWLAFAGIGAGRFAAIACEDQFAEKIHAYTLPWTGRENSRTRDLVDLILLIDRSHLDASRLGEAIRRTFRRRKTHDVPHTLPAPPASWSRPFAAMAQECEMMPDIEMQFRRVAQFYQALAL